jgi:DNA-binding NarL/FixJ family response regulator
VRPETPRAGSARPVAIIDLDRRVRSALADALRVAGIDVVGTTGETSEALRLVEEGGARVLVVDPRLPELADGQALVERVSATWPEVQIVIMGWGEAGDSRIARSATAFVAKSVPPEEFVAATLAACGY